MKPRDSLSLTDSPEARMGRLRPSTGLLLAFLLRSYIGLRCFHVGKSRLRFSKPFKLVLEATRCLIHPTLFLIRISHKSMLLFLGIWYLEFILVDFGLYCLTLLGY